MYGIGENMEIIIVGCGKVGRVLAQRLSKEDNNITVVDTNPEKVNNITTLVDAMGIVGNATSYETLLKAGVDKADIMIAVTSKDEVNLLTCVIAKRAANSNCQTIARVKTPVFSAERNFLRRELGISMIINPEYEAAREIARLFQFPSASEVYSFAKRRADMLRFKVPANSNLVGYSLKNLSHMTAGTVLICAVQRGKEVQIPDGNYVIQEGDIVSIITLPGAANNFFKKIGVKTFPVKNSLLIGGGDTSYYLAKILLNMGIRVRIIEKDRERCDYLAENLPKASIIHGDGCDRNFLQEEHFDNMDSLYAGTGIDEENLILSLYVKNKIRHKIVTKVSRLDETDVLDTLDLDSIISPKNLTAEQIVSYVRAKKNSMGSNVETLYRLLDGRVEALEFLINKNSSVVGIRLRELKLKNNVLIAGIVRGTNLIIPGGNDMIQAGDSVIVVTTNLGFQDVHDILA